MSDPRLLSDEQLAQIKERAEKATLGPWCYIGYPEDHPMWGEVHCAAEDGGFQTIATTPEDDERDSDMEFIAASRADTPALLAHIEALNEQIIEFKLTILGAEPKEEQP